MIDGTPERRTRRQEQGDQSREVILEAAARLMAANGFDGASISSISKESGLPASSIYWHFSSKDGVLAAVMERGAERFFASLGPVAEDDEATPRDSLRAEYRRASTAMRRDPGFLRLFMLLLLSGHDDETVHRVRLAGRERVRDALRHAYRGDGVAVADAVADELADIGIAMFDGAFLAVQNDGTLDYEELLTTMADALAALADAIAARMGSSRRSASRTAS